MAAAPCTRSCSGGSAQGRRRKKLIRDSAPSHRSAPLALLQYPAMNLRAVLVVASALATFGQAQTTSTGSPAAPTNATEQVAVSPPLDPCGARIRKPWDRLTPVEKETYVRAIERSMDDGLYIKFVEIHTEQMTTAEAHRTCMFVYWHRALLLAFENMLRSYGGEFACITVPYWDYVSHNALFLAGRCNSLEDCSPILRELGGSTSGRPRTVNVNGTPINGRCVSARPGNHFCEASNVRGPACAQCLPRGDWSSTGFPATTSVSSLMRQLFSSPTISSVATNLEQGVHNTIHNSLGGVMAQLEAPADPIFWSHHTAIDLLHSIFYHCAVGNTVPMSFAEKLADPRQAMQCQRRMPLPRMGPRAIDSNVLLPQSNIMFRSGGTLEVADSVHDPQNPLEQFFAPLATEYLSYSDIRDLGTFSYNYEMSGLLASMYTTCADISALLGGGGGGPAAVGPAGPFGGGGGFRRLEDEASESPFLEAVIIPNKQEAASNEGDWYHEALRAALNASSVIASQNPAVSATALALREVEKMTCMFYDECRGNVTDFTATFRSSFHTNASTPCFTVVSDVKSGRDAMLVTNWKDILLQFLSC